MTAQVCRCAEGGGTAGVPSGTAQHGTVARFSQVRGCAEVNGTARHTLSTVTVPVPHTYVRHSGTPGTAVEGVMGG